jgi:hypothetical protein
MNIFDMTWCLIVAMAIEEEVPVPLLVLVLLVPVPLLVPALPVMDIVYLSSALYLTLMS